ncbi:MAG: pyruvate kinase [Actinomycetota bacterium]
MSPRRAKLVCTLGPASGTPEGVRALAEAGCDVFRVNLSHGAAESHAGFVQAVRTAAEQIGRELAVMADLPGPKIRLGELATQPLRIRAGSRFVLRAGGGRLGDETGVRTNYPGLARDVRVGDRVLLADGAVELVVRGVEGEDVVTECVRAGSVCSHAGLNVPAERLNLPAVTDRDRAALAIAVDLGVDLLAQSFVRSGEDLMELRVLMRDRPIPIIAKIETRPAIDDIDNLLAQADGIMVARGDLGVELPMEEIPILQKELLRQARAAGKPAIVATQMLESMTHAPRPTRAEASDVANAVLDGADAIMLSAESAIGEFPIEAARAAVRIAEVAEERAGGFRVISAPCSHRDEAAAVAHAVAEVVAGDTEVVAIACFTRTGRTAALLSSERPGVPIYAFAPDAAVRRRLALRWGVTGLAARIPGSTDEMIDLMDSGLRAAGVAAVGDTVVMSGSLPAGKTQTNMLKVHHVGEAAG